VQARKRKGKREHEITLHSTCRPPYVCRRAVGPLSAVATGCPRAVEPSSRLSSRRRRCRPLLAFLHRRHRRRPIRLPRCHRHRVVAPPPRLDQSTVSASSSSSSIFALSTPPLLTHPFVPDAAHVGLREELLARAAAVKTTGPMRYSACRCGAVDDEARSTGRSCRCVNRAAGGDVGIADGARAWMEATP
jgi:hypothetical protein